MSDTPGSAGDRRPDETRGPGGSGPEDRTAVADELTGVFDHLTPEDFRPSTSAVTEHRCRNLGRAAFARFVEQQMQSLRLSYAAAEGQLDPIAVLASPTLQRCFVPQDGETMGDYVARLGGEARAMDATWVFISKVTEVGVRLPERPGALDVADSSVTERARRQGTLRHGVVWYAALREGLRRQVRVGIMYDENRRLGEPVETGAQGVALFGRILG